MQKFFLYSPGVLLFLFCLISCNSSTSNNNFISSDTAAINSGEILFDKNCGGCHNFKQNNIGPQLSRITKEVSVEWLHNFIHNPEQLIQSNDSNSIVATVDMSLQSFNNFCISQFILILSQHYSLLNEFVLQRVNFFESGKTVSKLLLCFFLKTV